MMYLCTEEICKLLSLKQRQKLKTKKGIKCQGEEHMLVEWPKEVPKTFTSWYVEQNTRAQTNQEMPGW